MPAPVGHGSCHSVMKSQVMRVSNPASSPQDCSGTLSCESMCGGVVSCHGDSLMTRAGMAHPTTHCLETGPSNLKEN